MKFGIRSNRKMIKLGIRNIRATKHPFPTFFSVTKVFEGVVE